MAKEKYNVGDSFCDIPISKKEFMAAFQDICESENYDYKKYYKTDSWKADFLITFDGQEYAFSIYRSFSEAEKFIDLMEQDGVKGYGLFLPQYKNSGYISNTPCFSIYSCGDDNIGVSISNEIFTLELFIKKVFEGNVVYTTQTKINAIDVIFTETECWKCGTPHSIYILYNLIGQNGKKFDYQKFKNQYVFEEDDYSALGFDEDIVKDIKQYITFLPGKKVVMGEIKERYSRTSDEWYMSFGCPKCDAILGQYYLNDAILDILCEEPDESMLYRITLSKPFTIPDNDWCVL